MIHAIYIIHKVYIQQACSSYKSPDVYTQINFTISRCSSFSLANFFSTVALVTLI